MSKTRIICAIIITVLTVSMAAASQDQTQIRRYLLSAGANNGGRDRVLLRYAVTDAKAFASVLTDMGGVDRSNAVILTNPSSKELLSGIDDLGKLVVKEKTPNVRHEVFIYYSGHADVDGLKLGNETLRWEDFRNAVNSLDAEIRVAVLDACGSGAITRTKGGIPRPAFLSDASTNMKGYAFLTSSNENEASQESDRIKGSYFTHALLSGMRGAADLVGDGKVTINEAYQYAFNETLRSTQNTSAGAQHPSRDMNLAGTGDIVMTDLRETSAILSLDADIEGRFFIRDASGNLFAELSKLRGRKIELGMPPGKYSVQMEAPSRMWMANDIVISEGGKTVLTMNDMKAMQRKATVSRGGGEGLNDGSDRGDGSDVGYVVDDGDELIPSGVADSGDSVLTDQSAQASTAASLDSLMAEKRAAMASSTASTTVSPDSSKAAKSPEPIRGDSYAISASLLCLSVAAGTGTETKLFPVARGSGVAQAGIINLADTLQLVQAGVVNAANRIGYLQAGVVNVTRDVGYFQAGTVNAAEAVGYFQAGTVNVAKDVGYFQAGVVNAALNVGYFQTGTVNAAKDVGYFQAGAVNVAKDVGYLQAGSVNIAHNVKYLQAGAFNIAGNTGYQLGSVNIASNTKMQVGALNIAKYSEHTPIGFLSVVGNGIYDVTAYADATGDYAMSLRTGTPWFYNLIEYSSVAHSKYEKYIDYDHLRIYQMRPMGYGIGTRFGMNGKFAINLDFVGQPFGTRHTYEERVERKITYEEYSEKYKDANGVLPPPSAGNIDGGTADKTLESIGENEYIIRGITNTGGNPAAMHEIIEISINIKYNVRFQDYYKLRLGMSYIPLPYLAITGGISLNQILDSYNDEINHNPIGDFYGERQYKDFKMRYWPGVYAGVTVGKVQASKKKE